MPRYLLIVALAVLCACHPIHHGGPMVTSKPPDPPPVRVADPPAPVETEPTPIPVVPPPPTVTRKPLPPTIDQIVTSTNAALLDAFFPYDRSELTDDAIAALRKDADLLRAIFADYPELQLIVEGHCDERGSAEYNLGLGDRRAQRAADLLERFGVPAGRIRTISYGKESPQCTDPVESCWSRNRRAHLAVRAEAVQPTFVRDTKLVR